MGKTGKQRRDTFYKLAKETGYRSRSAFKLLQLNRKYTFLQKSRVIIDLCAAPGGWLQAATQNMPVASTIIGVDIVPIKPIKNVITIQEDITSPSCISALKDELKTWKADVILNDGAPNVGQNWMFDAYQQATLTLSALRIATQLLNKGGWFITKLFRSKDYDALLWVFQKFFKKVHATKPQASRLESAEIFVVCQNYLDPDKIDPKLLNPKSVFAEVESEPQIDKTLTTSSNKVRVKVEGYPSGVNVLFRQINVTSFIESKDPVQLLSNCNEIIFDNKVVADHPLTTDEIKECCKDIKVLGKKELKLLMNWRKKIVPEVFPKTESAEVKKREADEKDDEEDNEKTQIEKVLEKAKVSEAKEAKRRKKKTLAKRKKLLQKLQLGMVIKNDEPITEEWEDTFRLSTIRNAEQLQKINETYINVLDPLLEIDANLQQNDRPQYERVQIPRKNMLMDDTAKSSRQSTTEDANRQRVKETFDVKFNDNDTNWLSNNPLLTDLESKTSSEKVQKRVDMWFSKESFEGLEEEDEEDFELDMLAKVNQRNLQSDEAVSKRNDRKTKMKKKQEPKVVTFSDDVMEQDENSRSDKDSDTDTDTDDEKTVGKENEYKAKKPVSWKLDPVGLAIGEEMMKSRKRKREIIDDAWHRYAFNDPPLPAWFRKDEKGNYDRQLPVTKQQIEKYREKQKAIDARPIKAIIESKIRKKKKLVHKLDKARKQSELLTDSSELTEKEKIHHIKAIYKKHGLTKQPKRELTYVVSKKGLAGKKPMMLKGKKARYRVVDPRQKKDDRKRKTLEKQRRKRLPKSKRTKIKKILADKARIAFKKAKKKPRFSYTVLNRK